MIWLSPLRTLLLSGAIWLLTDPGKTATSSSSESSEALGPSTSATSTTGIPNFVVKENRMEPRHNSPLIDSLRQALQSLPGERPEVVLHDSSFKKKEGKLRQMVPYLKRQLEKSPEAARLIYLGPSSVSVGVGGVSFAALIQTNRYNKVRKLIGQIHGTQGVHKMALMTALPAETVGGEAQIQLHGFALIRGGGDFAAKLRTSCSSTSVCNFRQVLESLIESPPPSPLRSPPRSL